MLISKFCYNSS